MLKRVFGRVLAPSGLARSATKIAAGSAASQMLLLAVAPLLTRLYSPAEFGILAIYASLLSIFVVVASLRWELAIPLPGRDDVAINLLALGSITLAATTALGILTVVVLGDQIARWSGAIEFADYAWLLPLGLGGAGAYQLLNYWAVRRESYRTIGITKFSQGVGQGITQVLLGWVVGGPIGLLVGDIVGRVAGTGGFARELLRQDGNLLRKVSKHQLKVAGMRYRRFPLIASGGALLNSSGGHVPPLMVGALFGGEHAGWFLLAQRVTAAPASLLGRAVAQVYMGRLSRSLNHGETNIERLFHAVSAKMFLLGLVVGGLLIVGGERLFVVIFGSDWVQSGTYARALGLLVIAQMMVVPVSQTLNILEKQTWQFWWDLARLVVVLCSFLVPAVVGVTAETTVWIYAGSSVLSYAVLYFGAARALTAAPNSSAKLDDDSTGMEV